MIKSSRKNLGHNFKNVVMNNETSRLLFFIIMFVFYILFPSMQTTIISSMSDSFITVAVFVAATLTSFYLSEKIFNYDSEDILKKHGSLQIIFSAFLGALPGCGGAIIVVSQYAKGVVGLGSLVAVLTATMGDASFLVLAKKPNVGFFLLAIGFLSGVIFGYFVKLLHPHEIQEKKMTSPYNSNPKLKHIKRHHIYLWFFITFLGLILGIADAFQVEISNSTIFGNKFDFKIIIGSFGTLLSLYIWSKKPNRVNLKQKKETYEKKGKEKSIEDIFCKVIDETNSVLLWVLAAFFSFNFLIQFFEIDISKFFEGAKVWVPLMSVLVGFLPGCGPQIIIASLFLAGALPLSAQVSNSISNDGDALFPAIALAPKSAFYATLYTAIPALIIGYTMFWLGF